MKVRIYFDAGNKEYYIEHKRYWFFWLRETVGSTFYGQITLSFDNLDRAIEYVQTLKNERIEMILAKSNRKKFSAVVYEETI